MSRIADSLRIARRYVFRRTKGRMETQMPTLLDPRAGQQERIAYTVHEAAQMLGVHYFSVYWLVQRKKLHACRALPGKLLIPRSELLRLLHTE